MLKRSVKTAIRSDTKKEMNNITSPNVFWNGFLNRFDSNKQSASCISMNPNDINDFYVDITCNKNPSPSHPNPHFSLILPLYKFSFAEIKPFILCKAWSQVKNPKSKSPDPLGLCPLMFDLSMQSDNFCKAI